MTIRAALFDMDGTIWNTSIDWRAVRREIDIPADGRPIYTQIMELPALKRDRGIEILQRYETWGAVNGTLVPGTKELLQYLRDAHVKCALVTNNSRKSVEHVLKQHPLSFDVILSRDDGTLKPDPQAFLSALDVLAVSPNEAIAIGDAHLDLIASDRAGIAQFILVGNRPWMSELIPAGVPHHKVANLV
ncbi:HAD-IA family hydrolase [Candidatus Bipolaricaulota bacterium]|nr:HAD-IA family hydrolase [Candidatus Bipolaricaulota bacterium]